MHFGSTFEQAGAELCQAQFKLGLAIPVVVSWPMAIDSYASLPSSQLR